MRRLLGALDRRYVFPLSRETTVRQRVARNQMPLAAVSIESFERDGNALFGGATHLALEHCAEEVGNDIPNNFTNEDLSVGCSTALQSTRRRVVDVTESPARILNYEWISDACEDTSAEPVGSFS